MSNYATIITVVNRTGFQMKLGALDKPLLGTWVIKPIDIPATSPSAIVFKVLPSDEDDQGSMGSVRYTVMTASKDKIKINFHCNSSGENNVNVVETTDPFKISFALTKSEEDKAIPLVTVVYIDLADKVCKA